MEWRTIACWIALGAIGLAFELLRRRRLSPILDRPCAGPEWRRCFPNTPSDDVREFLKIFVDGFALRRKHQLAFRPSDRILDVYRAANPPWQIADTLELETFARLLDDRYGLKLDSIWRDDLTLGDVFGRTRL